MHFGQYLEESKKKYSVINAFWGREKKYSEENHQTLMKTVAFGTR